MAEASQQPPEKGAGEQKEPIGDGAPTERGIRELYQGLEKLKKRIWSMEDIAEYAEQYNIMHKRLKPSVMKDIYGGTHGFGPATGEAPKYSYVELSFMTYQDMAQPKRLRPRSLGDPSEFAMLLSRKIPAYGWPVLKLFDFEFNQAIVDPGVASWEEHPSRKAWREMLSKAKNTVRIKRIVGFGLGRFGTDDWPYDDNIHHNLMVFDAVKELEAMYGVNGDPFKKIHIYLQDPDYDRFEKDRLREWLKSYARKHCGSEIIFCTNPEGFKFIDEHTLVLSGPNPTFPIMQLVADLTHTFSAPAGFLCLRKDGVTDGTQKWTAKMECELWKDTWPITRGENPFSKYTIKMCRSMQLAGVFPNEAPFYGMGLYLKLKQQGS